MTGNAGSPTGKDDGKALAVAIVADVIHRRSDGELVADEDILAEHPELTEELGEALHDLSRAESAERVAKGDESGDVSSAGGDGVPTWLTDAIPDYRFKHLIARGGQAAVYRATHVRTNRDVAIKVIRESALLAPRDVARFEQEARVLGHLDHPNIVAIHDSGTAAGCPYFVMDYITGMPLDDYVRQHKLSVEETLHLFQRTCRAVHAAHLRGVIHRDLKPSNVIIDDSRQPHILDFGLAKVCDTGLTNQSKWQAVTMTGQFVGSIPWASPEQVEGPPDRIDLRTDLYALGVMMYQLLTNEFPYDVTGNFGSVFLHIVNHEPRKPSVINRTINEDVDIILLKCLAKDPERRYASVVALAEDIEHYLKTEPIRARAPSTAYQIRKLIRRHKLSFGLVCAAATLVVLFAVVMTVLYARATSAEREAERARERAEREATTVTAIKEFLVDDLFESVSPRIARGEQVTVKEVLRDASERVDAGFAGEAKLKAAVLSTLGRVHLSLGLYNQAQEQLQEAHDIFAAEFGVDDLETLRNDTALVQAIQLGGHPTKACALGEQRLAAARRSLGNEHEVTLDLAAALTVVYALVSRWDDAASLALETLAMRQTLLGEIHPDTIRALNQVGMILAPQAVRSPDVEDLFRSAVLNARTVLGVDDPQTLIAMSHLGSILRDQRRFEEAEPLLSEAYSGLRQVLGEEHPALLLAMRDYATLLTEQNRVDESLDLTRRAVDLATRSLGADHHWTLQIRFYRGTALLRAGCVCEAAEVLETLSRDGFRVRGDTHAAAATYLAVHADALLRLGAYREADMELRRSLDILASPDGIPKRNAAGLLRDLVATLAAQQKINEARPFADRLLELRRTDAADATADAWQLNSYARELLTVYPLDLREPERALEIALKGYGRSTHQYHYNRYTVALAYEANGLIEEAIRFAKLALDHSPIEDSSERIDYERLLVRLYQRHGEAEAAENVYRNALSARRDQFGDFHEDVASSLFGLASVLMKNGKPASAEEALRECLSIRARLLETPGDLNCPLTTTCQTMETLATWGTLLESEGRLEEAQVLIDRARAFSSRQGVCRRDIIGQVDDLTRIIR